MAIGFIDGFDHYTSSQIGRKYDSVSGSPSIGAGRVQGQGVTLSNSQYIEKAFASTSQAWRIGFAYYPTTVGGTNIILLRDAATAQCELQINASRRLQVNRNGTLVGSAGSTTLALNTWYYIEWYVSIKDALSDGNCRVMLNGVQEVNLASGDIKNTANAFADRVRLNCDNFSTHTIDDLVVSQEADTTTPVFLGDRRVVTLYPNDNGSYSQFVGSDSNSTNNYQLIDDATISDVDYVTSDVVGNKDSYLLGDLPLTPTSIDAVQLTASVRKDDAGARTGRLFLRVGGTDYESADIPLSTSYLAKSHLVTLDPSTATAWSQASVNALEGGVKVEA